MPRVDPVGFPAFAALAYERELRRRILYPTIRRLRRELGRLHRAGVIPHHEVQRRIREAMRALRRVVENMAYAAAEEHVIRTARWHRRRFLVTMRKAGLDITLGATEAAVRQALAARIEDNVRLIRTIPVRMHRSLMRRIQLLAEGRSRFQPETLRRILREEYMSTGWNLRRLTRNETTREIGQLTQIRQVQAGFSRYMWVTQGDSRVRDTHASYDGQLFRWDSPPQGGPPGTEILCVPGSVHVTPVGLKASIAYRYVGDLIEVRLAEGVEVTMTPNHPVLTEAGWKRADRLKNNDQLLVHLDRGAMLGPNPHLHDRYPTAEQVHGLAGGMSHGHRPRARHVDLHGRPGLRDEEIDVVDINRSLRDRLEAAVPQEVANLFLVLPDTGLPSVLTTGDLAAHLSAPAGVASGGVGGFGKPLSLAEGEPSHADQVGLRTRAWLKPLLMEAGVHGPPGNPQRFADGEDAVSRFKPSPDFGTEGPAAGSADVISLAWGFEPEIAETGGGNVPADTQLAGYAGDMESGFGESLHLWQVLRALFAPMAVRRIRRVWHDDLVYSVATESHIMITNGVVTHNCRCNAAAWIEDSGIRAARGG